MASKQAKPEDEGFEVIYRRLEAAVTKLEAGGLTLEEIPGRGRTIVEDAPARLLAQRLAQYLAAGGARP